MKIVAIGCSHGRHAQLSVPDADVLIHTGDFSRRGDQYDAISFLEWFEAQPHAIKIFVAGNHERFVESHPKVFAELVAEHAPSCHYLHERSIQLGGLNWHGSNFTPHFNNWHFMSARGPDMQAHWDKIPFSTDILITHGPAMGHLDLIMPEHAGERDLHQGCANLRTTIDERLPNLKAHFFSHLHYQGCQTKIANNVTYINAAVVDDDYTLRGQIQVVDINQP